LAAELDRLAREREEACEAALSTMQLEAAGQLLRELRTYLSRQQDHRWIKGPVDKAIGLRRLEGGVDELDCPSVEFVSESRLEFTIRLEPRPPAWRIRQFRFHLYPPRHRDIGTLRIHLNPQRWHDSLRVPRCHFHVARGRESGKAHIPFPVMNPLLMLHLICEVIEPDFAD